MELGGTFKMGQDSEQEESYFVLFCFSNWNKIYNQLG